MTLRWEGAKKRSRSIRMEYRNGISFSTNLINKDALNEKLNDLRVFGCREEGENLYVLVSIAQVFDIVDSMPIASVDLKFDTRNEEEIKNDADD
mgnify:CR=1 FL=1